MGSSTAAQKPVSNDIMLNMNLHLEALKVNAGKDFKNEASEWQSGKGSRKKVFKTLADYNDATADHQLTLPAKEAREASAKYLRRLARRHRRIAKG